MTEPTRDQLMAALRRADAAGDTDAARAIARRIQGGAQPAESKQQRFERIRAELERRNPSDPSHPSNDPTAGMSGMEKFMAGAGKSVHDTGRGLQQLWAMAADRLSPRARSMSDLVTGRDPSRLAEITREVDRDRQLDAPLMRTGAGTAGNIAGQAAQIAVPIPGALAAKGAGLAGRVAGRAAPLVNAATRAGVFGATQGVGAGESRLGNAAESAAWGAGGQALASGGGRLLKGAADKMSPVVRDAYAAAQRAGIPVHFSQVTDSKPLKTLASTIGYLPFSGAGRANARQQEGFIRALARSFGEDAPQLTDDVMKSARTRLNREYTDLYKGKHIAISDAPVRRWASVVNEAVENLTDDEAKVVAKQFDKIIRKAEDGSITGEQYQALRTSLSGAIDGSNKGRYIKQLRNVLDETAGFGMNPRDAARLKKARGQWANMRTTEKALQQVGGAMGDVRPAALWPLIRNGSTPEMRELARIGQLLKDPIPDSGTAGRLLSMGLLGGGGAPFGGIGGTLGALAGGATVGRALNSPAAARYLMQGANPTIQGLARPALKPLPYLIPASASASEQP